ncbi:unnamed protein product [Didymodactylos carnosus]|uniref:Uncharacterized protein n=1 Tax=Didymodactylos carnosus TaxID=1234261 RepID=A0A8S2P707_9BILA|nr:unnamed protein product [Didymodactylos carnosus]CAF4034148.1 unnamed protein product [Didymodactylos carnosus]
MTINNENFKNVYLLSVWKTDQQNIFHSISNEQFIDKMINKQQRLSCLELNSYKLSSMSSLLLVKKQSQQNKSILTIENFYLKSSTITDHPQLLTNISFTSVKIDSTVIISTTTTTTTLSSIRLIREEEEENDQSILPAFFLFLFNASKSILPTSLRTPPRRLLTVWLILLCIALFFFIFLVCLLQYKHYRIIAEDNLSNKDKQMGKHTINDDITNCSSYQVNEDECILLDPDVRQIHSCPTSEKLNRRQNIKKTSYDDISINNRNYLKNFNYLQCKNQQCTCQFHRRHHSMLLTSTLYDYSQTNCKQKYNNINRSLTLSQLNKMNNFSSCNKCTPTTEAKFAKIKRLSLKTTRKLDQIQTPIINSRVGEFRTVVFVKPITK